MLVPPTPREVSLREEAGEVAGVGGALSMAGPSGRGTLTSVLGRGQAPGQLTLGAEPL